MIDEEKLDAVRQAMIAASFTAWQMGSGKKNESWDRYIERFGLSDKEPGLTDEEKKYYLDRAADIVSRVKQAKETIDGTGHIFACGSD